MRPPRILRQVVLTLAWAVLAGGVRGAETLPAAGAQWSSLLRNQPFAVAPAKPAAASRRDTLEFRGLVQEGTEIWVNLYEPVSRRSQWLSLSGSPAPGLRIESYDPSTDHLVVLEGDRRLDLFFQPGKVVLPADIRPLALPHSNPEPADPVEDERAAFIRQLPRDARQMLEQASRRRNERVPAAGSREEFLRTTAGRRP